MVTLNSQKFVIHVAMATLAFVLIASQVSMADEIQCGGKDMHLNATQKQELLDCLGKFGVKSILKLDSINTPCFGQCLLTVRGFISKDGERIESEKFMKHLDKIVKDEKIRVSLQKNIRSCIEQHGEKITKDDKTCMSFLEVMSCVKETIFEICVEDD